LARICQIANASGHVARFVVFGSFVTATRVKRDGSLSGIIGIVPDAPCLPTTES
jgi:hypothetical protein